MQINRGITKGLRPRYPNCQERFKISKTVLRCAMLTNEMKREAFLKLRTENFRASLRLEGLSPQPVSAKKPSKAKPALKPSRA